MRFRGLGIGLLAATAVLASAPAGAGATAIHVSSLADNATGCTLRNAISAASSDAAAGTCPAGQAGPTVDTIDFPSGSGSTITLTGGLPQVSGPVSISGPGASQLKIDGAGSFQPLVVSSGAVVSVTGLTITNGRCGAACGSEGGAILNFGTLTLGSVVVSNSTAASAGAGANNFAEGGAIENNGGATLRLRNSDITGNTVTASNATNQNGATAGAVMNRGTLSVDGTTISGNTATVAVPSGGIGLAQGGAIQNSGSLTITDSTINGNQANGTGPVASTVFGGAIAEANLSTVSLTVKDSTIAANTAAGGTGGGIQSSGAQGTVISSTVTGNSATAGANFSLTTPLAVSNTIVSNPQAGTNCIGGSVVSGGHNLEGGANTCGFNQASDIKNVNAMLGGLTDNGGPTFTRLPTAGSPAIDQGKAGAGEAADQRGLLRPVDVASIANGSGGDGSDIGAAELQSPDTTITSGPPEGASVRAAAFEFTSSPGGETFECSIDGGAFTTCTSPAAVTTLADGPHSFAVRAVDSASGADPTPAARSFKVDKTAPDTKLGKFKKKTSKPKVKLKFSSESGATFECRVDKKAFKACKSPYKTKKLKPGKHTIEVRATDTAGNVEAKPAKAKVKVTK